MTRPDRALNDGVLRGSLGVSLTAMTGRGVGVRGAIGCIAMIAVAACGSTSSRVAIRVAGDPANSAASVGVGAAATYPLGAADSPYWVAAWVPDGVRIQHVYATVAGRQWLVDYGRRNREADVQVSSTAPSSSNLPPTTSPSVPVQPPSSSSSSVAVKAGPCGRQTNAIRTTVRGHAACEYPDSDEGHTFGWIATWQESRDVSLTVLVQSPAEPDKARPIVARIAQRLRPIDARHAKLLERMTKPVVYPREDPTLVRVVAARGTVGGLPWTLTALLPQDFPLGADDLRQPCVEFVYSGRTTAECGFASPGDASRFVRIDNLVFAFGIVPRETRDIKFVEVIREPNKGSTGLRGTIATTKAIVAPGAHQGFYVGQLLADTCGVDVIDSTNGSSTRVGQALVLPPDNEPCIERGSGTGSASPTTRPGAHVLPRPPLPAATIATSPVPRP